MERKKNKVCYGRQLHLVAGEQLQRLSCLLVHIFINGHINVPNILAGPLSVPITDNQHLIDLMLK